MLISARRSLQVLPWAQGAFSNTDRWRGTRVRLRPATGVIRPLGNSSRHLVSRSLVHWPRRHLFQRAMPPSHQGAQQAMAKHLIEPGDAQGPPLRFQARRDRKTAKGRPRGLKETEKAIGAAHALDDSVLAGQAPALEVSIASVTIVHKEVSMA